MARGIEGLATDLNRQEISVGPGAYRRLLETLQELVVGEDPSLAPLARAWAEREFSAWYARPLLLLASLRYQALGDGEHPLTLEVLADSLGPDLKARLVQALSDPELPELLRQRSVQTNATGRAIGWGLLTRGGGAAQRSFHLVDLGCSAGLNLVADLSPASWRVGSQQLSGLDFPSPATRLGLDLQPMDVDDPADVRWLRACIWPGASERRQRLEWALQAMARAREAGLQCLLEPHVLGTDPTDQRLANLAAGDSLPTLAYQSVVRDYLAPAQAQAHVATMHRWLLGGPRRLWLTLEPIPEASPGPPMALDLHLARAGDIEIVPIARTDYHPTACHPGPDVLARLSTLWQEQTR